MFEDININKGIRDIHLIRYGIILNQNIIYSSNPDFDPMLEIVNFVNSFAMNVQDGRLYKIKHEYKNESHVTLVQARTLKDNKQLMYVLFGPEQMLPEGFHNEILDNYVNEIEKAININRIEKIYQGDFSNFIIKMNRIADKIDEGLRLIHEIEKEKDDFLVKEQDYENAVIYYIGISTMGLPIVSKLYGDVLLDRFNLPVKDGMDPADVLQSLMSAQFSAIVNSSRLKANTVINEITINFTLFETMEIHQLKIAFYQIGLNNKFTLEICYEGNRSIIEKFQEATRTLFEKHLQRPFRGNLDDFQPLVGVLDSLPNKFALFPEEHPEIKVKKPQIDDFSRDLMLSFKESVSELESKVGDLEISGPSPTESTDIDVEAESISPFRASESGMTGDEVQRQQDAGLNAPIEIKVPPIDKVNEEEDEIDHGGGADFDLEKDNVAVPEKNGVKDGGLALDLPPMKMESILDSDRASNHENDQGPNQSQETPAADLESPRFEGKQDLILDFKEDEHDEAGDNSKKKYLLDFQDTDDADRDKL
ncbi:MAG: hypothetical protein ACTSWN_07310 [Promethearchaeota archaeon]